MTHKPPQGIDARRKPKFRAGQVVGVYGIPEIKQAERFLGYRKIGSVERRGVSQFYMIDGGLYRESRLRLLTKREAGR